jgi:branched-subunit amino acid transport protein
MECHRGDADRRHAGSVDRFMDQTSIFLTILGMCLVTYLPRLLPVWLLSSRQLPRVVITWLRYVPAAVLSAMLLPSLLLEGSKLHLAADNLYLLAAIPTLLVAWKTRSMFGAVIVGMGLIALARLLI